MRTSTRLLLNTAANLTSAVVGAVTGLILTPVMIHYLGRNVFGVWSLAGPVTLYAPLILLGVSGAITRFVAAYMAQDDHDSMNATVNTARAYFYFGTIVLTVIGLSMAVALPRCTNIEPSLRTTASWCVIVLTLFQAVAFFFGPTGAILHSLERFDLLSLVMISSRTIRLLGILLALALLRPTASTGLLIVAVIMGITDAANVMACSFLARHYCRPLRLDLRLARWELLWPMIGFGLQTLLWAAVNMLLPYVSLFVIGHYLSDADVGDYAVPERVLSLVALLVNTVVTATAPVAARLSVGESADGLRMLLLRSAKYTSGISLASAITLGLLAPVILKLWVGEQFLHVANVLLVLAIGRSLWCAQASDFNVLFGMKKQGGLGFIGLACVAAVAIIGTVAVGIYQTGLMGMATVCTAVSVIGCGVAMPIYTCRKVGVSWLAYVREAHVRPLVAVLPLIVMCLAIRCLPLRYAWFSLAGGLVGGAVLSMLGFWFLMFDDWDRELFRDRVGSLMTYLSRRTPSS